MKGRGRLTRPGRSVFQKVDSYSSWSGDRVATGDARLGMADTPRAVPAADEIAAVTAMAARGWSDTSEDRSIWTVAPRRVTVSRATKCGGVPAPRSKALQSQTRTAKRSKRAAISASGSGMQHGGVERTTGERAYLELARLLSWREGEFNPVRKALLRATGAGGRWRRIVLGDLLAEHVVELRGTPSVQAVEVL